MDIVRLSENTVIILFEQSINRDNFALIRHITHNIKMTLRAVIVDIIPSYASIHITFNLIKISGLAFQTALQKVLDECTAQASEKIQGKTIEIPVYYGKEVALDLSFVAQRANLTEQDVIDIHANKFYDVYAIGFAPGFAYLGDVDDAIACPRKDTPRTKICKGSLGIADQQTAIYPTDSPGGWQIIGRTPLQLIDFSREEITQFSVGDKVKFNPISRSDFLAMGGIL